MAASASFAGSYQLDTQTTLVWKSGFTRRAASVKPLMPDTTSGIGKDAIYPAIPDFDIFAASVPQTARPS